MRKSPARLAELRRTLILDSSAERAYDDITKLLATALQVPTTVVNLLDHDRDWFKSCVGLLQHESPAENSFCSVFFDTLDNVVIVPDTAVDPRFANHPLVVGSPFIRFYAGARLTVGGQTVGTLCAYDVEPKILDTEQMNLLRSLATAAMQLLDERVSGAGAPTLSKEAPCAVIPIGSSRRPIPAS